LGADLGDKKLTTVLSNDKELFLHHLHLIFSKSQFNNDIQAFRTYLDLTLARSQEVKITELGDSNWRFKYESLSNDISRISTQIPAY
jgi:hypothetical protein